MRRRDKAINIEKANILAEQRYLETKGILTEAAGQDNELKELGGMLQKELTGAGLDVRYQDFSSGALGSNDLNDQQVLTYIDESGLLKVAIPAKLGGETAKKVQSAYNNIAGRMKNGSGIDFEAKYGKMKVGEMPAYSMLVRLKPQEQAEQPQQTAPPARPPVSQ